MFRQICSSFKVSSGCLTGRTGIFPSVHHNLEQSSLMTAAPRHTCSFIFRSRTFCCYCLFVCSTSRRSRSGSICFKPNRVYFVPKPNKITGFEKFRLSHFTSWTSSITTNQTEFIQKNNVRIILQTSTKRHTKM